MVRASGLRGYTPLMRALGVDPLPLLARARIAPEALEDDDALISLPAAIRLLEASAATTRQPDFGLQMARAQDISVLGPLAVAMRNAPTVGHAVGDASRYLFMHSPAMVVSVHDAPQVEADTVELRFELRGTSNGVRRQIIDLCLADLHTIVRRLAGAAYCLRRVDLPHTPVAPLAVYQRFFGAPVRVAQEFGAIHVARQTLAAGLVGADESLREIAVDFLATNFRAPEQTVATRVEQALRSTLGTARCNKVDVAGMLSLHPRTLQRQLAAEGATFAELRETVRRRSAQHYLCETHLPLIQLAGVLGLSEPSVLTRSCRRWFGATPSAVRARAVKRQGRQ